MPTGYLQDGRGKRIANVVVTEATQDAAQSWFVNLQVSSDLKTWEDVQPGQFLGSDSARFFRIKTSEQ